MLQVPRNLVNRARTYIDDDSGEVQGFLSDAAWLNIFNVEYQYLYRKWLRMAVVRPQPVDEYFPSGSYQIVLPTATDVEAGNTGVLAVVGVAEDMSSYMRYLTAAQPSRGPYPYWVASGESANEGKADSWACYGAADSFTVELHPRDVATGSNYKVRWIPTPPLAQNLDSSTVDVPWGVDERLVLGMARRACLKDHTASALLERMIADADAETQFAAHGRLDVQAPRVRRVKPDFHRRRWPQLATNGFPTDSNYWMWP